MLEKRDIRAQIVIIENGKYILLKHWAKIKNIYFWALPGGGREKGETVEEAAVREAMEETGLKIKLLPVKLETIPKQSYSIYNKLVTYAAYPLEGIARTGYDPEEEMVKYYQLVDLKWQNVYDDEGLDEVTKADIIPLRNKLDNYSFKRRAGILVYKIENKKIYYLIGSNQEKGDCFSLPSVDAEKKESLSDAALRYSRDNMGIAIDIEKNIGFFFEEERESYIRNDVFLAQYRGNAVNENLLNKYWINYDEFDRFDLTRQAKRFIYDIDKQLRKSIL